MTRLAAVLALATAPVLAGCAAAAPSAGVRAGASAVPALALAGRSGHQGAAGPERAAHPAGCAVPAGQGWVAAENARPGTPLAVPRDALGGVTGYLDAGDAACGDTVSLHLGLEPGARPRQVVVRAYRLGWYAGAGARAVWRSGPVLVTPQAVPSGAPAPHLVVPDWPVSVRARVDAAWVPGFYALVPQDVRGRTAGRAVPLVVRDPGGQEPVLFKASTLTWDAYDEWGDWSLYHGPAGNHAQQVSDRARVVSLQRPLTGSGYNQFLAMDLPVVRTLEHLAVTGHLDVAYTTDASLDADPGQLQGHAELVSGGHSEYWTTRMYDAILAAADRGTNLVFLGANNLWWHARLEGGTPGAPAREVVYRVLAEDPLAAGDPSAATVLWQSAPLHRDPAAVLGQSHAGIGVHGGLQLLHPPAWYTAGTGLTDGSVLPGAVGNEADGFNPAGHNPARTQVFAAGVLTGAGGSAPVLVTTSYSVRPSGAAVFAAGTTDWACAPTDGCTDTTVPPATGRAVGTLTANVVTALATPRAGLTHPAGATVPLTVATLRPTLSPAAAGTYGGAATDETAARRHPVHAVQSH